jgi:hypothetical protein
MKIVAGVVTLLIFARITTGQSLTHPNTPNLDPCPRGSKRSLKLDTIAGRPTLDQLLYTSHLIIVGTVAEVLPTVALQSEAGNVSPVMLQTHSLVDVEQMFHGLQSRKTILLTQIGGELGSCSVVVPEDPLVKNGERYLLFLQANQQPNDSGFPGYHVIGYWAGKAKIVDGKIEFLPHANPDVIRHNGMEAAAFLEYVQGRLDRLRIGLAPPR